MVSGAHGDAIAVACRGADDGWRPDGGRVCDHQLNESADRPRQIAVGVGAHFADDEREAAADVQSQLQEALRMRDVAGRALARVAPASPSSDAGHDPAVRVRVRYRWCLEALMLGDPAAAVGLWVTGMGRPERGWRHPSVPGCFIARVSKITLTRRAEADSRRLLTRFQRCHARRHRARRVVVVRAASRPLDRRPRLRCSPRRCAASARTSRGHRSWFRCASREGWPPGFLAPAVRQ